MYSRALYAAVVLVVIGAWFSNNPAPPKAKPGSADNVKSAARILTDLSSLGVDQGQWIEGGKCNIEFINGTRINSGMRPIDKNGPLKLKGWAFDDIKPRLPNIVIARFASGHDRDIFVASPASLPRADVRDYFNLPPSLETSGFELVAAARDFPPGEYAITLILPFDDVNYVCDNGRHIKIR
jgi:hypothetical protein